MQIEFEEGSDGPKVSVQNEGRSEGDGGGDDGEEREVDGDEGPGPAEVAEDQKMKMQPRLLQFYLTGAGGGLYKRWVRPEA